MKTPGVKTSIEIAVAIVLLAAVVYLLFKLNIIKIGAKATAAGKFNIATTTEPLSGAKYLDPKINPFLLGKKILLLNAKSTNDAVEKIHNSMYSLFGYNQNQTVGLIENLKSKTQVAQVAEAYTKKYNSSLRTDMNDRLWNNVAVDYKTPIVQIIDKLPIGILNDKGVIIK